MKRDGVFVCTSESMHPYECGGAGKCRHCDAREDGQHIPWKCAFCLDDAGFEYSDRGVTEIEFKIRKAAQA